MSNSKPPATTQRAVTVVESKDKIKQSEMRLIFLLFIFYAEGCINSVTQMSQYGNFSSCDTLVITDLPLRDMNITTSANSITIQACWQLQSINLIIETEAPVILQFINNTFLSSYRIYLNSSTYLYLSQVPYPQKFQLWPNYLVSSLSLISLDWNNISVFTGYNYLSSLTVQQMPNLMDMSILKNNKFSQNVQIIGLPSLISLNFLESTTLSNIVILSTLSTITSLYGLNSLQKVNLLVISKLASLRDISGLSSFHSGTINWVSVPNICCPDFSTGIYSNIPAANIPPCKDCFNILSFTPDTSPLEGQLIAYVRYNGSIRSNYLNINWGQTYTACNRDAIGMFSCTVPSRSSPGPVVLQYSLGSGVWHPINTRFTYISWQSLIAPFQSSLINYTDVNSPELIPPDNSVLVSTVTLAIWVTIGILIFIALISLPIFSLPNDLDLIRTPVIKNLGAHITVTGSTRTPMGAFFSISCMLLVLAVFLSSIVSFTMNNNWVTTSLTNPLSSVSNLPKWQVMLTIYPGNLCSDPLAVVSPSPSSILPLSDGKCMIEWKDFSPESTIFSIQSTSWIAYAYYFSYQINSTGSVPKLTSSISGGTSSPAGAMIKGGQAIINLMSVINILQTGPQNLEVGTVFESLKTPALPVVPISNFLEYNSLTLSLNIKLSDYWQTTFIQSKQSNLEFVAQVFALCSGVVTLVRLTMYIIARKIHIRSGKPDIELRLRKSTAGTNATSDVISDTGPASSAGSASDAGQQV